VQLNSVLYKWFTAMCSEAKPMTGPMIIEEAKSFYDEMKIIDKCLLCKTCNRKLLVRT